MQLDSQTNGLFSYFFPWWTSLVGTYTSLRFGNDARIRGGDTQTRVQTTRIAPGVPRCQLCLVDISVDGRTFQIEQSLFRLVGFSNELGFAEIILVGSAYRRVREAMVQYIEGSIVGNLCEENKSYMIFVNYTMPSFTFLFAGAELLLESSNIFEQFRAGFFLVMIPNRWWWTKPTSKLSVSSI